MMTVSLERGGVIPDFTLVNIHGEAISSRSFYMRRNFVIALLPDDVGEPKETWFHQIVESIGTIPARDVICLIITQPDAIPDYSRFSDFKLGGDRVQLLIDTDRTVSRMLEQGSRKGKLLITDRYGVIFHAVSGDPSSPEMDPSEIPSWIELIACRCS